MIKAVLAPLQELAEYEEIVQLTQHSRGVIQISGCIESQKIHFMNGFSGLFPYRLIITEDEQRAKEILNDYRFYDKNIYYYPAKDMLFFQADIQGNLLVRERMKAIRALLELSEITIVTSIDACMDYLPSLQEIRDRILHYNYDSIVNVDALKLRLTAMGYERVGQVELPGQFAIRGGIIDIYLLTEENPIRIELFDDEIESIRSFDSQTQRSIENLEEVTVYPVVDTASENQKNTFLDYFSRDNTLIFLDEPNRLVERGEIVAEEVGQSRRHREEKGEKAFQEHCFCEFADVQKMITKYCCISLSALDPRQTGWNMIGRYSMTVKSISSYHGSFEMLVTELQKYKKQGYRVVLLSGSRTRANRLAKDLISEGINAFYSENEDRVLQDGEIMVMYGHIQKGFEYSLLKFALISESDIFGQEQTKKKRKKVYNGRHIQDFAELTVGDYVIHERYGLGMYQGLDRITIDRITKDYIKILYQGNCLYILATQLDSLQKYSSGDSEQKPKLNKIGTDEWHRTKSKVRKAVKDIAKELVELYAARQQKEGFVYGEDTVWQREFEEMFPYEETEDQLSAIEDCKRDMQSTKIMDRLICGDVGYGKTEIALRAAFKAVQESRQVAYLVPTTILAQQHYNTFVQRMSNFPVRVDLLCRFRTPAQQKKTLSDLKKGLVDIVIGTHRMLSKDVDFKNLGLLIIDEEQRFGVTHKEKIKQLKKDVDVLTLTATPIPRTLHMSMIGIRDMSVLEEPPIDRMPIQTYVMEYDEETVREAISRELRRDGQVYYVYNRVNDIVEVTSRIAALVPDARVEYAHGQMSERQLEKIMYQFISGEIDVLVATTIIETGLDIPNCNTMIIHDSDRFGLSQLYQLRGRIGRSNRTAYAFLMYRRTVMLKETAEKRLAAMREYTDLGSGFKISMRDLELRGAGNLLGAEQHGHMNAVGYDLYCKMLNEAVQEAKGIEVQEDFDTTIDLTIDAFLPEKYISNEVQKLDIYKRIAGIETQSDYDDMLDELLDRFGNLPSAAMNLLLVAKAKAQAHKAYVTEIKQIGNELRITFYKNAKIDGAQIPALLLKYKRKLSMKPGNPPVFIYKIEGKVLEALKEILDEFTRITL